MFDLGPAAQQVHTLVSGVRDDQLTGATPCQEWTVADLVAHVHQFATVFTANARKQPAEADGNLPEEWRTAVPRQLDVLAEAWRDESAWHGRLSAGGVEMDAEDNAMVAIEELVVHGWDLARATGQPLTVEDAWLYEVDRFFAVFAAPIASGQGPYGPAVPAPEGASRFESLIARTGRQPGWTPPAG